MGKAVPLAPPAAPGMPPPLLARGSRSPCSGFQPQCCAAHHLALTTQHGSCELDPSMIPKVQRGKLRLGAGPWPFGGPESSFQTGPWEQRGLCFHPAGGRSVHTPGTPFFFVTHIPDSRRGPPRSPACHKQGWKSHTLPKGRPLTSASPPPAGLGGRWKLERPARHSGRSLSLLVNTSPADHSCHPESTGRNTSFSPNLCAYLRQQVPGVVTEGAHDSVKKGHRSKVYGTDCPGEYAANPRALCQAGISNSIS